jgi:hypothetical protein
MKLPVAKLALAIFWMAIGLAMTGLYQAIYGINPRYNRSISMKQI